jgi:hypothetical protein
MHFKGEVECNTKNGYYGERAGTQVTGGGVWQGCFNDTRDPNHRFLRTRMEWGAMAGFGRRALLFIGLIAVPVGGYS